MRVAGQTFRPAGHFEFVIKPRIEPARGPGFGREPLQIVQHDKRRRRLRQLAIEPSQIILASRRMPQRVVPQNAIERNVEIVLDQRRVPARAGRLPQLQPIGQLRFGELLDRGRIGLERRHAGEIAGAGGHEDDLRSELIESGSGRQDLLAKEPVLGLVNLRSDTLMCEKKFDQLPQLNRRRAAQNRQPNDSTGVRPRVRRGVRDSAQHISPQLHQRRVIQQRAHGSGRPAGRRVGTFLLTDGFEGPNEVSKRARRAGASSCKYEWSVS